MKCTDTKGRRLGTLRKLDSRLLGVLTEEAVAAEKKKGPSDPSTTTSTTFERERPGSSLS